MKKLTNITVTIILVLILSVGMSFSVVLAKTDDLSDESYHTNTLIGTTYPITNTDTITNANFDEDDRFIDTTNADPNFDPLSSFDAEILDTLRDADPETRIDYDATTGTVTIPDQDAILGAPILQTDGYMPDSAGLQNVVTGNGEGDQRIQITNVNAYPYIATVYLRCGYEDGAVGRASGALVGPNTILTAGHVVYNHEHGWMKALMAKPGGVNSNASPILTASWSSVKGWVENHNSEYDYGVIVVNNSPGVGYYGMKSLSNDTIAGSIYCYGYPCDKPNLQNPQYGTLWYSPGHVYAYTPSVIYHTADTYGCNSGGPIVKQSDYTSIIAIHTGGQNSVCNRSVRITPNIISFVQSF